MAIVEDEVRNESEDENEIEVVVEEDDAEQDSDDSDDDDDEGALERKVAELERRIAEDPYNYNEHIELIQSLWALTELDRWRNAFERLQQMTALRAEHWLLWLQTEASIAHSWQSRERIAELFKQATLDCYSIPILTEWCTWAMGVGDVPAAREQLDEVLRRAGADPFSGKLFWDAKLELEKSQLDTMSEEDSEYKTQQERVLWCLEETVSRPLLRGEEAWPQLQELAAMLHDQTYIDKVKKQHEAAVDYLHKVTTFEDKLLTTENVEEKLKIYQDYIETVKDLSHRDEYAECDSNGILKVVYDRASTECSAAGTAVVSGLLAGWARATRGSSRTTVARVLDACIRRCPRLHTFWALKMQQAEHEEKTFDEVKGIFETALSKGMESYKEAEALWLSYLEFIRRRTAFDNETDVDTLRRTFRLAWDSLAEAWGEEANDCEVPLYWARLEYKRMNDPKQGKEIFEEIFKYGENKSMSKYWEALLQLELWRVPAAAPHKLRGLLRRALRCVADYPPAPARLWTDYERDHGALPARADCAEQCEAKLKEWRENYQAMKDKMTGKKQKPKQDNKKSKFENKKKRREDDKPNRKRKSGEDNKESEAKKKKDDSMDVEEKAHDGESSGVKRSYEQDDDDRDVTDSKRQRTDETDESSNRVSSRDACTLFVSNLEFKVDEESLRNKLSDYGEIVSLRVKAGVKAFGGSICYCQYKTPEAVEKALKHDRTPLNGRPMFLSRYSADKTKSSFKYPTTAEKNKLFVKNLPFGHCTKEALTDIFEKYGKLKDIRVVTHKDGKPKGLAYVEYEEEASAQAALAGTRSLVVAGRTVDVALSAPPPRAAAHPPAPPAALGQPKRDAGGGMRRTQLSSFIPSVLQRPSTSKAATNGDHTNGEKRPLNNSDFRNMLLNK